MLHLVQLASLFLGLVCLAQAIPVAAQANFTAELLRLASDNLKPWTLRNTTWTTAHVAEVYRKTEKHTARFIVQNGTFIIRFHGVTWHPGLVQNVHRTKWMLENVHAISPLPDGLDVVINMEDNPIMRQGPQVYNQPPVFSFCTAQGFADVLIPQTEFNAHNFSMPNMNESQPWSERQEVAFWRGTPTGALYTKENWRGLPRPMLVNMSVNNPNMLDAKMVKCFQCEEGVWEEMLEELGHPDGQGFPSRETLAKYKYLVDMDGNGWSSRFVGQLPQGSAILKVRPKFREYFWELLAPYVHYVPVRGDLSNLLDIVEYARTHDAEMQAIAAAAGDVYRSFSGGVWQMAVREVLANYHAMFPNKREWEVE